VSPSVKSQSILARASACREAGRSSTDVTVVDGGRALLFVAWDRAGTTISESYQRRAFERASAWLPIGPFPGIGRQLSLLTHMVSSLSSSSRPHSRPALNARQNAQLRSNLARVLKSRGLSGRELAAAAGLGAHFVSDIGKNGGPSLASLLRIVEVLGLNSVDELLGPSGTSQFISLGHPIPKDLSPTSSG
jgi:DNA-binding phage protein